MCQAHTCSRHRCLIPNPCLPVQLVQRCRPNPAHLALAAFERKVTEDGRRFTLITQVLGATAACVPKQMFFRVLLDAVSTSNEALLSTSGSGRTLMGYMQLLGRGMSSCYMALYGMSVGLTGMLSSSSGIIRDRSQHSAYTHDYLHQQRIVCMLRVGGEGERSGSPCRRGMKASKPYENRKQPLVSTGSTQAIIRGLLPL